MKRTFWYIYFILCMIANSCTEIYVPELKNIPKVLVIEGIITNEQKMHTVLLSHAIPYDTLANFKETGAIIYVTDDLERVFNYSEIAPGVYRTFYLPETGRKYRLTVETKNNKIYQSTWQELLPNEILPIYSNTYKTIDVYKFDGSKNVLLNVAGAEFIASLNLHSDSNYYYRFDNSILTEFTSRTDGENFIKYCWRKYNPNQYFNINSIDYNKSGNLQHDMGFFPVDSAFYGVVLGVFNPPGPGNPKPILTRRFLKGFYLTIKQFKLNEDIYKVYKSINKQLEANQRFFDPISAQVVGNIKCINDSTEKVFGLFEASSVIINTYKIEYPQIGNSFQIKSIAPKDLDSIPLSGENPSVPPGFWIY